MRQRSVGSIYAGQSSAPSGICLIHFHLLRPSKKKTPVDRPVLFSKRGG